MKSVQWYFVSGASDTPFSQEIPVNKAGQMGAHKTVGPVATGIIPYYL